MHRARYASVRLALARDISVKDADLRPIAFIFLDELRVSIVQLILIVCFPTFKNHVQRNIELAIIDVANQIRNSRSGGEKNGPRVIREVFLTSRNHRVDGGLGIVFQRKIDHVTKHEFVNANRVLPR